MTNHSNLTATVVDEIMVELQYDWVQSIEVAQLVKRVFQVESSDDILSVSLGVISRLVFLNMVEIGQQDCEFRPWEGKRFEVLERATEAWLEVEDPCEACGLAFWLRDTPKGDQYGREILLRRES